MYRRRNTRKSHYELSERIFRSLQQRRVLTGTIDAIIEICEMQDPPQRVAKFLEWAEGMPSVPFIVKRKLIRSIKYPMVFYTIRLRDTWRDPLEFL